MFDIREMKLENTGHMLNVPVEEIQLRLSRVRQLLSEKSIGVMIIVNSCADGLTAWLTGCPMLDIPFNRDGGFIISAEGQPVDVNSNVLVTEEYRKNYRKLDETVTLPARNPLFKAAVGLDIDDIAPHILPGSTARVGIVHPNSLTCALHDFLCEGIHQIEFIDLTADMTFLRAERTPFELDNARHSAGTAQRVFSSLPYLLREGRLESEVAADIRKRVYDLGAGGQDTTRMANVILKSCQQQKASDESPLTWPGRRMQNGDMINICLRAASVNDTYAAIGRLYVLGQPTTQTLVLWDKAVCVHDAAAHKLTPGNTLQDALIAMKEECARCGVELTGMNPIYGIGYIIGEVPIAHTSTAAQPLRQNMILCVAPTIREPGHTEALCCMDTWLITAQEPVRLTASSRKIVTIE